MTVLLRGIVSESKDGDWGLSEEAPEHTPFAVIRGTDFPNVRQGDYSNVPIRYLPNRTSARRVLIENDILIETAGGSRDRPTGRTLLITCDVLDGLGSTVSCASFARFLRVDRTVAHPPYVFWLLQAAYLAGELTQYQIQHTGVARFQYTTFSTSWLVDLPDLSIQGRVADVLGSLDEKIAANRRVMASLDQLLAWRLEKFLHNAGSTQIALSAIANVNPDTTKPSDGQIRYLDISSVSLGSYEWPQLIAWAEAPGRARRALRRGDTVWSTVRPNRQSHALVMDDTSDVVASTGLAVLRPVLVSSAYLYEISCRSDFVDQLVSMAEGSAYPAVRADRFEDVIIPLLSEPARREFDALGEPAREWSASLVKENRALAELRDTLLPPLMSGRLAVKAAEGIVSDAV